MFRILLSAIFQDTECELQTPQQKEPIEGLQYTEVMYADHARIFGTHTRPVNKVPHAIHAESQAYILRLNLQRCVNLTTKQRQSSVKFPDGQTPKQPQS